ncbi:hypothetical protein O181_099957 [Austropuccinia psidii MF-1]|uniref:Uncharacterized protein n=1 Tax=Austropuccinia psidii MF-1 TaxID=1389203 RepID=A0A9Q3PH17_9BASI|nr:hypothetical protein [Austropuccinia psidii MF-1]
MEEYIFFQIFKEYPQKVLNLQKNYLENFPKSSRTFKRKGWNNKIHTQNSNKKTVIDDHKDEKAATIPQKEEWRNWKPPQISPENENLQINVGLGQTKKRASRQENQIQPQQEHKNQTQKSLKKKIPGAYHEEDEVEEEIRVLIQTKYNKPQEGKERDNENIEIISNKGNK